jgi:hypothetical protein
VHRAAELERHLREAIAARAQPRRPELVSLPS